MRIRKKGVAIVESEKGVLVVAGRRKIFSLPGGGADRGESRRRAATRELREETGLKTEKTKYLFSYKGKQWHDHKGRRVINHAKVFLVKAYGTLRPRHEIKYVAHWKPGSKVRISKRTEVLIRKYLSMKKGL
jgi:8-oxo-dGTP diphosphatase